MISCYSQTRFFRPRSEFDANGLLYIRIKMVEVDLMNYFETEFTTNEQIRFIHHFNFYLETDKSDNKFPINLDNVYKWIGFTKKTDLQSNLRTGKATKRTQKVLKRYSNV